MFKLVCWLKKWQQKNPKPMEFALLLQVFFPDNKWHYDILKFFKQLPVCVFHGTSCATESCQAQSSPDLQSALNSKSQPSLRALLRLQERSSHLHYESLCKSALGRKDLEAPSHSCQLLARSPNLPLSSLPVFHNPASHGIALGFLAETLTWIGRLRGIWPLQQIPKCFASTVKGHLEQRG